MSMLVNPYEFGTVAPPTVTTLNPSDKSANIALSGGNLTATMTVLTTFSSARATNSKTAGKWYFEATSLGAGGGGSIEMGIGTGATSLASYMSNTAGMGYLSNGIINLNGANLVSGIGAWNGAGATSQCALDIATLKIWFRLSTGLWNNDGTADPATGAGGVSFAAITGGAFFPMVSTYSNAIPDALTVNFGATSFVGTVPSGFAAWG